MMTKEIETNYVFIDTSIFIKENYFKGKKLYAFFDHGHRTSIELLTTKITIGECLSNLDKHSRESFAIMKKMMKELNSKGKSLKNIESLESMFSLPSNFDFEKEIEKLNEDFICQMKLHFDEIEISNDVTEKVLADYFSYNAPFKDGKKKHEFPDAFVLNSLETWCKLNGRKVYVVSEDDDMNSFQSDYLIPVREYDKLLEQISFTYGYENISPKIDAIIRNEEGSIIRTVEENFIDYFPLDGWDNSQGFQYEVQSINEMNSVIEDHSVLFIEDNIATVELIIQTSYEIDVEYEDTSSGWFDKEDEMWYGTEQVRRQIANDSRLTVLMQVEVELPGTAAYPPFWSFHEISNGIPEDIQIL